MTFEVKALVQVHFRFQSEQFHIISCKPICPDANVSHVPVQS